MIRLLLHVGLWASLGYTVWDPWQGEQELLWSSLHDHHRWKEP